MRQHWLLNGSVKTTDMIFVLWNIKKYGGFSLIFWMFWDKIPSVSDVFTVTEAGRVNEMYHPKHCTTLLLGGMITVCVLIQSNKN